ncbi:hypothetical protein MSUIS_06360 [Mycoplasma suis KI3806]|uniref:Uncharacterized protein n=1 Tax=Mycoplasma suis (strain KI_3806) TaxID=708248 RepID=F0V248_MYCS3|nr:hypothetical protein [Mycoplasma suis]CBZ40729.1 hypothetical protein MSUIS_06360 [Mycoplasma suis KI3806]
MKVIKLTTLLLSSLVVVAGGGYTLNKFISPKYIDDKQVLWETVRVFGNGNKKCQILLKRENKEQKDLHQVTLKQVEQEKVNESCSTSWSHSIYGKKVQGKDNKIVEYWLRGKNKEILNGMLPQEDFNQIEVFEEESSPRSPLLEPSSSIDSQTTVDSLKNKCQVEEKNDWITIKCPKNSQTLS